MSKKKRKRRKSPKQKTSAASRQTTPRTRTVSGPGQDDALELLPGLETRAAEYVTIIWVLCTLATAASLMGTTTFAIVNAALGEPEEGVEMMQMLPQWFVMVGALTGLLGLIANTLTHRWRNHTAPPIVRFVSAVICGIAVGISLLR